jgi:hypothetical protein
LEFKPVKLDFKRQIRTQETPSYFVVVEAPEFGVTKTLQCRAEDTVKDLFAQFLERCPIKEPSKYAIFHKVKDERKDTVKRRHSSASKSRSNSKSAATADLKKASVLVRLEDPQPLSYYKLNNLDRLIVKQHNLGGNDDSTSAIPISNDNDAIFGADISTLDKETDENG